MSYIDWKAVAETVVEALEEHDKAYEECTCSLPYEEQPAECWYNMSNTEQQKSRIAYVARRLETAYDGEVPVQD